MQTESIRTTEIKLKFIVNDELIDALKNYLDKIIESCQTEEEKAYYSQRKSNIHARILNADEQKEVENYLAYKAGFNSVTGNYYSNWRRK